MNKVDNDHGGNTHQHVYRGPRRKRRNIEHACWSIGDFQIIDNNANNLGRPHRCNSQIVTTQAQGRNADN